MKMNLITIAVTLAIGVILIGSLLVPVISNYGDEEKSIKNTGSYFTTPDGGDHEIVITKGVITYDGEECAWPDLSLYGSVTLMIGTDWILRADNGTNPATDSIRYTIAGPPHNWTVLGAVDPASEDAVVITISDTDVSFDGPSADTTKQDLEYMIADKGDYVMSLKPYILDDTPIVAAIRNNSNTASSDTFEIIKGSVDDVANMTYTVCRNFISTETPSIGDITSSTFTADTTTYDGDLLKLDKITQVATMYNSAVATFTITYVIVPEVITYDNPAYVGYSTLFAMIPVLVITALVIVAAGVIYVKREY